MNCPVCAQTMVQEDFGLTVDVCENGCKGIFFDRAELQKLDMPNEGLGAAIAAALKNPRHNTPPRGQIKCPRCGVPMHEHQFNRDKEVNVDECYNCGGFFLDSGELKDIRDHYMTDTEVAAYTDQLIGTIPAYAEGLKDLEAQKIRNKAARNFSTILFENFWKPKSS